MSISQILTLYRYRFFFANIIKETHSCVVGSFSFVDQALKINSFFVAHLSIWALSCSLEVYRTVTKVIGGSLLYNP